MKYFIGSHYCSLKPNRSNLCYKRLLKMNIYIGCPLWKMKNNEQSDEILRLLQGTTIKILIIIRTISVLSLERCLFTLLGLVILNHWSNCLIYLHYLKYTSSIFRIQIISVCTIKVLNISCMICKYKLFKWILSVPDMKFPYLDWCIEICRADTLSVGHIRFTYQSLYQMTDQMIWFLTGHIVGETGESHQCRSQSKCC